ncbi:MAG TPA: tetratricopeptide repeat protein [Myxococcota bacterium]|nr:tetratricopeptide repeat protein [Myxococcota bacterium]HRY93973.1 tetratricopeptide repeat protein [Myxococcota bacterium]HSA22006.1 tetratricopeptide repeat protein [Myxococcota bacterium]
MSRAADLAAKIEALTLSALEDGTLARDGLRQLVLGLARTRDALSLWGADRWEDYGEHADEAAFASLSLAGFLDELDAVVIGAARTPDPAEPPQAGPEALYRRQQERQRLGLPLEHPDPEMTRALDARVAALREDCLEALRQVARGGRLGEFPSLVGLMLQGLSPSGYADLVAFYHPDGAGELLPIHEHLPPDTDSYAWGTLLPAGVRMFYPEGDEDSLAGGAGEPRSRLARFADMRYFRVDDDDVHYRLAGDLEEVRLTHGHCHEEWGGPSQAEVDRRLGTHFGAHPELALDPLRPPLPDEGEAFERFVGLFEECRLEEGGALVRGLVQRSALDAVPAYLERLSEDHPARERLLEGYAEALLEAGQPKAALGVLQSLAPQRRQREWREELDCLRALGRHARAVARADELAQGSDEKRAEVLPWKALALVDLGRAEEALALLAAEAGHDDLDAHRAAWARAYALRQRDPLAAEAALAESLASGDRWLPRGRLDFTDAPRALALIERRLALDAMAAAHAGELARLERPVEAPALPGPEPALALGACEAFRLVARAARPEGGRDEAEVGQYGWVFRASWRGGLTVHRRSPEGGLRPVSTARRLHDDGLGELALGPGWLAVAMSPGALIYDLTDPARPEPVALLGRGGEGSRSPVGLAARGDCLLLATGDALITASLADPRAPRPLAHLRFPAERGPGHLELHDDVAVLESSRGAWLVDVRVPADPRPFGFLPEEVRYHRSARLGDELLAVNDQQQVWRVEVRAPGGPRITGCLPLLPAENQAGETSRQGDEGTEGLAADLGRMGDPRTVRLDGERLEILTSKEALIFERCAVEPVALPDPAGALAGLEPRLAAWIEARLEEVRAGRAGFQLGALILERWGDTLRLHLDEPRSLPGLEAGPVAEDHPNWETKLAELAGEAAGGHLHEGDPPPGLPREAGRAWQERVQLAWLGLLERALRAAARSAPFRALAAGQVFLVTAGGLTRLVGIARDPSRPWVPARRAVPGRRVRSLEELLADHETRARALQRLRAEPGLREELWTLAAGGSHAAVRAAEELADLEPERAVEAVRQATAAGAGDVSFLAGHLEQPGVRDTLEQVYRQGRTGQRLRAAEALGRCEEDEVLGLVRELLSDPDCAYDKTDLAGEVLEHIERRLPELLPDLVGWLERASARDNRLPLVCRHLYRAGLPEPPAALLEQAAREKRDEEYHSVKTGIRFLDQADWSQAEACLAERLWTGRRLARRVLSLREADDARAPLWDPAWAPEPHPASWTYLLASAWPHLEAAGAVPWLFARLAEHATAEPAYATDRLILLRLVEHLAVENDVQALLGLSQGVLAAPEGAFGDDDERVRRRVRRLQLGARVVRGFALLKAGGLAEARAQCDAALALGPDDGQALFLDARLAWLEAGSPEAGLARAEANLERTEQRDEAGRGRLLNLGGCALDALQRWEEARTWFERAYEAHPADPMYLANLAEVHEKLGDLEEAVRFASKAKRKGVRSEVVLRILSEHPEGEDREGDEDPLEGEEGEPEEGEEESEEEDAEEDDNDLEDV